MMKNPMSKKAAPWITGLLLTAVFFAALQATQYFRFENSDDILLVKGFLGYEGGTPSGFNAFVHPFLTRPLQWLSSVLPGVPWFSWLQLALLFGANAVLCQSFLQCSNGGRASSLIAIAAAGLFLTVFSLFLSCRLNYTTTAALVGAASVARLLAAGMRRRNEAFVRSLPPGDLLSSILLLACAYCLRSAAALPSLVFWVWAYLLIWIQRKDDRARSGDAFPRKTLAIGFVACLCIMALLPLARMVEIRTLGLEDWQRWHEAKTSLMDYHGAAFDLVSDRQLQELGWSRSELELVREWYFMDRNITTDALERLARVHTEAASASPLAILLSALGTLTSFFSTHPAYLFSGGLLLLLCCIILWRVMRNPGERTWVPWLSAGVLLLAFGMLVYLCIRGRILSRAVDSILLPAAAMLFCLALSQREQPKSQPRARALTAVLCLLCIGLAAGNFALTWRQLQARPDTVSPTRQAQLEAYGLEHPDQLFLYTPNLLRDTRLFPDVYGGIPANLMIWGDWYCRTPSWYAQLAKFGFDGPAFTAEDFLGERMMFVCGPEGLPPALIPYLEHALGDTVEAQTIDTLGDLIFYRFRQP